MFYWTREPSKINKKKWNKFCLAAKSIFESSLIPISDVKGEFNATPMISKECIAFNGEDGDAADYFCICKEPLYDSKISCDGLVIGFCDTNHKLYERVVKKILEIALYMKIVESWWKK